MSERDELMSMLFVADPETASIVQIKLLDHHPPVTEIELGLIVAETIWGLSQETALGQAIATGLIELAGSAAPQHLEMFRCRVRETGEINAAIGQIIAIHLVPVLKTGDNKLIERFNETTGALLKIGSYTLKSPFETLTYLIESADIESGMAFLELIGSALSPGLSYNQCKHLCHIIPKAVQSFPPSRRLFQIVQLMRVAQADPGLIDGFLDGMQRGGSLLDAHALPRFVSEGLGRFSRDKAAGSRFLSLESRQARDLVDELQVAVSLSQIQPSLNRYIQARLGRPFCVRPMSELSATDFFTPEKPLVCSCGNRIFLPDEISRFDTKTKNRLFYKFLTRIETGYHEFETYEFDLEKAINACGDIEDIETQHAAIKDRMRPIRMGDAASGEDQKIGRDFLPASDMHQFCRIFPNPGLAADLLTIFEHGRIRVILEQRYPGIILQSQPVLIAEAERIYPDNLRELPLEALYLRIALGIRVEIRVMASPESASNVDSVIHAVGVDFCRMITITAGVEDCAALVWKTYPRIDLFLKTACLKKDYRLKTPFAIGLRPDLALDLEYETKTALLQRKLSEKGVKVYKSGIRKLLFQRRGKISKDDILELVRASKDTGPCENAVHTAAVCVDLSDLANLSEISGLIDNSAAPDTLPASWYPEWDDHHSDYLHNYVRVVDRMMAGASAGFYDQTLARYRELINQIRYAFELMKPQGLKMLRNWTEGDELDYRAMLDFVLDQKAGLIPSDRLYIKRVKQERNVAVLLLVDLSRSTANTLSKNGSDAGATVLDIEKEAMVLFCEALGIVGDTFAIAGFSGNGRFSVDFTHIKEFDEPLNDAVRKRISALTPQRGTRMGAAIRHATAQFDKFPAKVRLMVVLGDGFPNDLDYKREYAISDTRKAIGEALTRRIHTHAITVNMQSDARLDDLYGSVHHNVISDVRELPARLLRIYGALTYSHPGA
jgi:nitric oxide reductase NorD protein